MEREFMLSEEKDKWLLDSRKRRRKEIQDLIFRIEYDPTFSWEAITKIKDIN